jgi:adhesin/invasin
VFTHGTVTGTATTQSGGNWLSFNSFDIPGENSYAIVVTAQSVQAPGSYTGSVVVAGDNPADNQTVSVTLNVTTSPIIQGYGIMCTPNCPDYVLNGSPGDTKPTETVSFFTNREGTLTITGATASSMGNFLSASVSGANTIVITADPGTLSPGYHSGTVTIASNAANNSEVSVPVVFIVDPPGKPLISEGGIVDIGEYAATAVAPGEILAVFGNQFAAPCSSAVNPGPPPLATTLGGTQVLVNGTSAPLYFSSPEQVNFQLPYETPVGQLATVQVVSSGTPGNIRSLNVNQASAPALLVWPASVIAGGYGIVVNQDNSLVLPTAVPGYAAHPAKVGDTITIYCTGAG